MTTVTRSLAILCGAAMLASVLACGGVQEAAARQKAMNELKQLLLAYHMYVDVNSKPPASAADLSAWAAKMAPDAVPAINNTSWTVFWGVPFAKMPAGAGSTVLAHGPTAGPNVIVGMADGSVKLMTVAEFNAATKAGKGP